MAVPQIPLGVSWEANPYPALIPFDLEDKLGQQGFSFFRTLIETIRDSHTTIMSGGTTFPWQMLTQIDTTPQFQLGGMGRFRYPGNGIISARYCLLATPGVGYNTGGPVDVVGAGVGEFGWAVSQSAFGTRTVGFLGGYTQYAHANYGWVIYAGTNVQGIRYTGPAPGIGARLARDPINLDSLKVVSGVNDIWIATAVAAAAGGMIQPLTLMIHT